MNEKEVEEFAREAEQRYRHDPEYHARVYLAWQLIQEFDYNDQLRMACAFGVLVAERCSAKDKENPVHDLADGLAIEEDRHPSTRHFARLFAYGHLPPGWGRDSSMACATLAQAMVDLLADGPELTAGLRKLLEAKDCFVRAALS